MTKFGGFLDSSLDRLSDMVVFLGIMMFYAGNSRQHSLVNVVLAGVGMISSVMVSYTTARSEGFGRKSERRIPAASGTGRAVDNRSALNVGLEFDIIFANRMPQVLWVLAVGSDLDDDPSNVFYLEGISSYGRRGSRVGRWIFIRKCGIR